MGWIGQWKDSQNLDILPHLEHFFLKGGSLTNFSEQLILRSRKEVLVVNPFVDQCDLSDSLWKTVEEGKDVILSTRSPEEEKDQKHRTRKEKQHKVLRERGVRVAYNQRVHTKLIVVDKAVAAVSSMNLTGLSTGGSSWEAGLVTKEDTVVESIVDSIYGLLERPDSETQ